ncbi:hypothetical protein KEM48_013358 [Puccinia striiformis f. sp. tritici PST-130]|nr:hypothetical protein KEM48_013358 [Puccinia striiformis f. sp. tritici PST-130]
MALLGFKNFFLLVITLQASVEGASVHNPTLYKRQFDLGSLSSSVPGLGGASAGSGSGASGLGSLPSMGSGTGGLGGLGSMAGGLGKGGGTGGLGALSGMTSGGGMGGLGGLSGMSSGGGMGGLGGLSGMSSGGGMGGLSGLSGMSSGGGMGGLGGLTGMGSGLSGTDSSSNSAGGGYGSGGTSSSGKSKLGGSSGGCPAYHMIGARGTSEGPTGSIAYNAVYQKVLAAVPGGAKEELEYSTSADYSVTVTQGAQTEIKLITGEISKCPKTVFAMVQTQTLNNKDVPQDKIAAVVLFGNPYFKAGSPQNKCGANSGMGIAAMAGAKMPGQLADRVYDCCVPGDQICQTAGSIMGHLSYGQHENDAAEFVIQKLKAKLSGSTTH